MITATVAVTTAANAVAMMNATASSTRLPRRMKFLNPVISVSSRRPSRTAGHWTPVTLAVDHDAEDLGRGGGGDAVDVLGEGRDDHQPAGEAGRRAVGLGRRGQREDRHVDRDVRRGAAARVR